MGIPKILFLDLETTPNKGYFWTLWVDGMLGHENVIEQKTMLSASWAWNDEKEVHSASIDIKKPKDDYQLTKTVIEVIAEADAVVAHNGDQFDMKWVYARAAFHRLPPPPPVIQIDTKKLAKLRFNFNSNRLDALAQFFGIGKKIKTDFDLWKECLEKNPKALDKMVKYNKHDILLLRGVYAVLRPYVPARLNRQLFGSAESCSACGSNRIQYRGFHYTTANKYRRFQCTACGHWDHSRKAEKR